MRPVCIGIEVELFLELFSQYGEALFLGMHGFCDGFDDELSNIFMVIRVRFCVRFKCRLFSFFAIGFKFLRRGFVVVVVFGSFALMGGDQGEFFVFRRLLLFD